MPKLNHIGIASSDLPKLQELFSLLGLTVSKSEEVPEQGVHTHFIPLPGEAPHLEFLVPLDETGPVAQFLDKRGPGIHHLSFQVEKGELDPLCGKIASSGFRLIYPAPRPGAQGMRINFIHPASAGGMLIELMEPA